MDIKVLFSEDPGFVLSTAGGFLSSRPVLHNLILSILDARVAEGDPGRYLDGNATRGHSRRCNPVAPHISRDADTHATGGRSGNG